MKADESKAPQITMQMQCVLDAMEHEYLKPYQIAFIAKAQGKTLSTKTVSNELQKLKKLGLVKNSKFNDFGLGYHWSKVEHPNPCAQCPNVGHKTCCCEVR